ncbi:uncharacterized protein LOC114298720 [Camellia sinensis]|uniref:uncharacterized protein LOC114298720 n=1 Tax=Camellia sinensis TaxID=4442 RepID=UPI001036C732|nr:uncharacterized protein LOC114298720 [Camellia sinensis]
MAKEAEEGEVKETPGRVIASKVVDIASEGMEVVPIVAAIAAGVARVALKVQVEGGATGPEPRRGEQPQGGPTPQGGGVSLTTAICHARAVARQLEGEKGPARAGADRLVGIVTTLAGTLLRKAGAVKLKADESKAQLARLKKESANWESAHVELQTAKVELENTCRQRAKAVKEKESLRKELEVERAKALAEKESLQKELEAEKAKATTENESLQKELEAEKAKATAERATLDKELAEERAKAASERAAYPDLYVAAVDQFKGSAEFQIAVDAAVASSLAREESGGRVCRGRLLEEGLRQK